MEVLTLFETAVYLLFESAIIALLVFIITLLIGMLLMGIKTFVRDWKGSE